MMKRLQFIAALVLLCCIAAQAQTDDYQPLVREGVRWVNTNEQYRNEGTEYSCLFVKFEFYGDTIIQGKSYLNCFKYTDKSLDLSKEGPYCAMREEGRKIYEVPFTEDYRFIYFNSTAIRQELEQNGEFLLMDFDQPYGRSEMTGSVNDSYGTFIPGIGFDSRLWGNAFEPYMDMVEQLDHDTNGFHHLEDLDGNILYKGLACDLVDTRYYHPLVREGVVWHYAYEDFELDEAYLPIDSTYRIIDQKMEFRGDTTIYGVKYNKCYLYETEQLTSDEPPYKLAREQNGKVIFAPTHFHDGDTYYPEGTLPGPYFDILGEYIVYDFGDMAGFLQELGWPTLVSTSRTMVGEDSVYCYQTNNSGKYVESVGYDGERSGYLNDPFVIRVPCICPDVLGLIMLTDLDGNILYKGNYYHVGYELPKYDLNHDGVIDIADVNLMINVLLGYDVPTGNQGHDTAPAISPDEYYDITGDGHVDIADVNAIINKMLGK